LFKISFLVFKAIADIDSALDAKKLMFFCFNNQKNLAVSNANEKCHLVACNIAQTFAKEVFSWSVTLQHSVNSLLEILLLTYLLVCESRAAKRNAQHRWLLID